MPLVVPDRPYVLQLKEFNMAGTPEGLSPKLARFLASLKGANREAIEATIALLPLGMRISLAINEIIDTYPEGQLTEAANRGEPVDFKLTQKGAEIIEQCARWHEDESSHNVVVRVAQGIRNLAHH
jgi:hypothetical protein